ncbi:DUF488 family protein [Prolixibacter sp. NT017]|uniref:DUF488 domain-containing protein n=1 Tax=Prolixibacter sp. NT017 TaxID=2652390 RepID=UPI00127F45BF|nr:DUF488 domain-containing protein [Prolixibacter sp. NT017]GET25657.1 hypothetical protein NT017_19860 [Prolixibacter sp. NT017]
MEFFTIGVYNSTEEEYFRKLIENNIDTFCDIRQRRGLRGAKYAFVNSNRLQSKLKDLAIEYKYFQSLAPTSEIREFQKKVDKEDGAQKRTRNKLSQIFTVVYKDRILSKFDFDSFIDKLEDDGAKKVVLFCVEENPMACHRSIVTDKLEKLGYKTTHL